MVEIEVLGIELLANEDVVKGRVEVAVVLETFFFLSGLFFDYLLFGWCRCCFSTTSFPARFCRLSL
jgi:hypothetical protein